MDKRIIVQVKISKNGQRRVTIPKEDKTLKHDDFIEIKKVEIK